MSKYFGILLVVAVFLFQSSSVFGGVCEDKLSCTTCQTQTGCSWCSPGGICLNVTATYHPNATAAIYCGGTLLAENTTCSVNETRETCFATYGTWDCKGCKNNVKCGWCSNGAQPRCFEADFESTCTQNGDVWNATCPQCNLNHSNCSSCHADQTCGWCPNINICVTSASQCQLSGNTILASCPGTTPTTPTATGDGAADKHSASHNSNILGFKRTIAIVVAAVVVGIILIVIVAIAVVRVSKKNKKKKADQWY